MIALLSTVCFADTTQTATTTEGSNTFNWSYTVNDSNQITDLKCTNSDKSSITGNIAIPSTINNVPVTEIDSSAFAGFSNITGITLPDTVTYIGVDAFKNCTSLANVNLGKVEQINATAFQGCTSLESITIPKTLEKVLH